jgi:hypothetical protein
MALAYRLVSAVPAANRAKYRVRTLSPEALAASSDKKMGAENFTG